MDQDTRGTESDYNIDENEIWKTQYGENKNIFVFSLEFQFKMEIDKSVSFNCEVNVN